MKKKISIIIIGFLIIFATSFTILNLVDTKKNHVQHLTKQQILNNYESYLKENNLISDSLLLVRKTDEKEVYELTNDCYFVIGFSKNNVEKVYLYLKKGEKNESKYLEGMIYSINPNMQEKKRDEIMTRMMKNEKADELGIMADFKIGNYQYLTLEKENGDAINYFIYYDDRKE